MYGCFCFSKDLKDFQCQILRPGGELTNLDDFGDIIEISGIMMVVMYML